MMARRAVALYRGLDDPGRKYFFSRLATEFSPDPAAVLTAATAYHATPNSKTLAKLQGVTEPPRQEVFRRMNMASGGTAAGGAARDLLAMKQQLGGAVDHDLTLVGSVVQPRFLSCAASTGIPRLRSWRSSSPTKRCMRSGESRT
jgi:malonyl-CoA decarboxylase